MHTGRVDDLLSRWSALHPATSQAAPHVGVDLVRRYGEPHRRYHDTRHLAEVLDAVDELSVHADDLDAVRLAAWFHDAAYDVAAPAGANERASADLAASALAQLGHPAPRVAHVARLVRLTATHDPAPDDGDGQVLCDGDLWVLGADPRRYGQYAADVRAEYAHVPEADFTAARAAVLGPLLDRESVYATAMARERWEHRARANVSEELTRLRAAPR